MARRAGADRNGGLTLGSTGASWHAKAESRRFMFTLGVCSFVGACFRLFLWRAARVEARSETTKTLAFLLTVNREKL